MAPYPHTPKSTKSLVPGEFWPIRLPSGRFACGRVIELTPVGAGWALPGRAFLAGLVDWTGDDAPTAAAITGRKCIYQVRAHVKAILRQGFQITGHRDLAADAIEPFVMSYGSKIVCGHKYLRAYNPSTDRGLPSLGVAGPDFLNSKAAYIFEKKPNQSPEPTAPSGRGSS